MALKSEIIDVSSQFNFLGFLSERFHTLNILNQPCVEAWAHEHNYCISLV